MIGFSAMRDYLEPVFLNAREERLVVMTLDMQRYLINSTVMAKGDIGRVSFSVRNIMHQALNDNAAYVVIAHNHPGGVASPSPDDINRTVELVKALGSVNIRLDTHLIFGARGDFYNMFEDPARAYLLKTDWNKLNYR